MLSAGERDGLEAGARAVSSFLTMMVLLWCSSSSGSDGMSLGWRGGRGEVEETKEDGDEEMRLRRLSWAVEMRG